MANATITALANDWYAGFSGVPAHSQNLRLSFAGKNCGNTMPRVGGCCDVTSLLLSRRPSVDDLGVPPTKELPVIKPFAAVKAAFNTPGHPPVHFHQSGIDDHPEVCYDAACRRPHLAIPGTTE